MTQIMNNKILGEIKQKENVILLKQTHWNYTKVLLYYLNLQLLINMHIPLVMHEIQLETFYIIKLERIETMCLKK